MAQNGDSHQNENDQNGAAQQHENDQNDDLQRYQRTSKIPFIIFLKDLRYIY
jgi:hypothetical protein